MNFARESLVSGEKVLYSIWEPKIRQSWLRRFRLPVMRTLHTAHLLILTDQEVILIREDERVTENKGIRYGGVWQFIPVRQIATAEIVDPDRDTIQLVLSLSSASRIRIPFSQSRLAELKEFLHTANWS
jgi:hypothetical protein